MGGLDQGSPICIQESEGGEVGLRSPNNLASVRHHLKKNFSDRNTRPTVSHNLLKKCRPRPRSAIFGGGDTEIGAAPSYADEGGPDFTADHLVHAMNARSATSSPAVA